jgi:DNA mismatch endonuclease (patch repair protein)
MRERGRIGGRAVRLDPLSPTERSKRMSRVRNSDTRPELTVRKLVHGLGYRYRLHDRRLPGNPDLVFVGRRKIIFVHGCFWHMHRCHHGAARVPKSRLDFWVPKLQQNRRRDLSEQAKLRALGWRVLVVWECELRGDLGKLTRRFNAFLGERGA